MLLLNTTLTVRAGAAASHQGKGWETFTDEVIRAVNAKDHPVVFILWGSHARRKRALLDSRHVVIESAHPSPLSAHNGFFGSKPFSRTNAALEQAGLDADRLAAVAEPDPLRPSTVPASVRSRDDRPTEQAIRLGRGDPARRPATPRRHAVRSSISTRSVVARVEPHATEAGELANGPAAVAVDRLDVHLDDLGCRTARRCWRRRRRR